WVRARSLAAAPRDRRPTAGQALRVLGPLAWWMLERGGGAVPAAEMHAELVRIEAQREDGADAERQADELMALLRHDSALLRSEPGERWAFVHPSVAEFFAARDAERDPARFQAILDDPFRAEWREIVAFLAGILGVERGATARLDALVERALEGARRPGRYQARHPSLLVALLSEEPDLSARHERALVRRLFELWFTAYFSRAQARRVQDEAVAFLSRPVPGRLGSTINAELRRWFEPQPSPRIRWDRLLQAAVLWPLGEGQVHAAVDAEAAYLRRQHIEARQLRRWTQAIAGPLVRRLPAILRQRGINSAALLAAYADHPLWQLRFAARAPTPNPTP
ncbi:MAG: hypothetical protein KC583_14330, partial [Myxococcales bacterium]|nr:hypothetical protein [Myxococcales bacterium]